MPGSDRLNVAYFITHHGFGHATRAAAVMAALAAREPRFHFHIFSKLPELLFRQVLGDRFTIFPTETDVGLIQQSALEVDLTASLAALNRFYPLDPDKVSHLTEQVKRLAVRAVFCDIAPLGIAVAAQAAVPSVLIENFTFHWIYEDFLEDEPGFQPIIDILRTWCEKADFHLQTKPVSDPQPGAPCFEPIARPIRLGRVEQRRRLGLADARPLVLITMGGFGQEMNYIEALKTRHDITFMMPGTDHAGDNLICPRWEDNPYHPDLIAACDLVVGKLGYSTFAEVYHAGVPFAYIPRDNFRESIAIEAFIKAKMPARAMAEGDFHNGRWLDQLGDYLALPPNRKEKINGADQVANYLIPRLGSLT
ncbi:hypothetical protein [Acanthopleuribacter pedis]|uniref:Glycosyl transferase family 28 C-terminal domain-containing protein n=1 Tax=Acanthopleuribacter pedis TaxID=442870 RepID=A0A8J7QNS0_9BACT|nr:hypothetical protein [Acanthopleuribacter pedis]MBO1322505.1 hypothetical protein [Acanthopleuribacter pedis]